MISGSHDGLIIYWDTVTGEMDSIKPGNCGAHTNQVQCIKHNKSNNLLITCGLDDTLKFIDLNEFKYSSEIKLDSQPRSLDSSDDMTVVACINQLVAIKEKSISQKINISFEATSISISKDLVAVGGNDKKVHVYSKTNFQEVATLSEWDFITAVRFSHDGEYLAVADNAKNIKCYKMVVENNVPKYANVTRDMWQHHAGKITNLSWSPDSKHLASSSVDTHCFVYSTSKINDYIQIKNAHPLNPVSSCAWLDDNHLVTSSQDCCLRKWRLDF